MLQLWSWNKLRVGGVKTKWNLLTVTLNMLGFPLVYSISNCIPYHLVIDCSLTVKCSIQLYAIQSEQSEVSQELLTRELYHYIEKY